MLPFAFPIGASNIGNDPPNHRKSSSRSMVIMVDLSRRLYAV